MLTEPRTEASAARLLRLVLGRRTDWRLSRPRLVAPRPGVHWTGPILVVVSIAVGWPAFAGAVGEDGPAAFGLFIGAASITLMSWSFLLAVRLRWLESLFGGLDSMYRVHRWTGTLAVVAMWLHIQNEPEIEGGIRGASKSMANAAEDLAGLGEKMLYVLVAVSLLRWVPYRWWRLTHKLLGIPFVFACFHFFTATKTYENSSGWGLYYGSIMGIGLLAYVGRVLVIDPFKPGLEHRITDVDVEGRTLEVTLEPAGRSLGHRAGQFAVIKIQRKGLSEPHVFTIASSPNESVLRFYIRSLGDWTDRLFAFELVGSRVFVEGPYGRFEPCPADPGRVVWVAGGVGITPFLAAIGDLEAVPVGARPTLFYAVRDELGATAITRLRQADLDGRIRLVVCASSDGRRFSEEVLADELGSNAMAGAHVAVCGPASLVADVVDLARRQRARRIEHEDFDIRQGLGPDLSRPIADAWSR